MMSKTIHKKCLLLLNTWTIFWIPKAIKCLFTAHLVSQELQLLFFATWLSTKRLLAGDQLINVTSIFWNIIMFLLQINGLLSKSLKIIKNSNINNTTFGPRALKQRQNLQLNQTADFWNFKPKKFKELKLTREEETKLTKQEKDGKLRPHEWKKTNLTSFQSFRSNTTKTIMITKESQLNWIIKRGNSPREKEMPRSTLTMKDKEKFKSSRATCLNLKSNWNMLKRRRLSMKSNWIDWTINSSKTDSRTRTREKKLKDTKLRLRRDSRCGNKNSTSKKRSSNMTLIKKSKAQEERLSKESNSLTKKMKDKDF